VAPIEPRRYGAGPHHGNAAARPCRVDRGAVPDHLGARMTHVQFLRIKKLTGKGIVEVAARHNHREILAEIGATPGGRIDPARVRLNRILCGHRTAADVASQAQTMMSEAGIKATRKDAVKALEIIFSLPCQSSIDHDQFFNDSVQWAGQYFGAPVISAIVHNDEATPHCHVLMLPLVNGRMVGSDLMGGRAKLQALQAAFHAQVGQRHGLSRQASQKRHSATIRRQAIDSAFNVLQANSGLNGDVLRILLEPHLNNPEPLMLALHLDMPKPNPKGTFVGIMTKPCKPQKAIGYGSRKSIGFDEPAPSEKHQTLSCVGFANSEHSISDGIDQRGDASKGHYVRERDDDQQAGNWSEALGEFIRPSVKTSYRSAAIASVRGALESLGRDNGAPGPIRF
jgi:hypothetical protein